MQQDSKSTKSLLNTILKGQNEKEEPPWYILFWIKCRIPVKNSNARDNTTVKTFTLKEFQDLTKTNFKTRKTLKRSNVLLCLGILFLKQETITGPFQEKRVFNET